MKKLAITILGSLLIASYCYAQSASTVEQTGDWNNTAIQQVGGNNSIDIDQGIMNNPAVIPDGLGSSFLGGMTSGNTSHVIQQGGNKAYIYQGGSFTRTQGNTSTIHQYASEMSNDATTFQYGKRNTTTLIQGQSNTPGNNNLGVIAQYGDDNVNQIRQYSTRSLVFSITHGNGNHSTITQSGYLNQAAVVQCDVSLGSFYQDVNNADPQISTYGGVSNGNTAHIHQMDDHNIGIILQSGNVNGATLNQAGFGNFSTINQHGNSNTVNVSQSN